MLRTTNLGKRFDVRRNHGRLFLSNFGIGNVGRDEDWVLRGVDVELAAGEALGVIGENGAGKSTFLKLLSGVVSPSEGQIEAAGRISAILELGIGFNQDFTGRENARHVLSLMGFTGEDIAHLLPEVENFAELGVFFDRPVRTYSSGMSVRLAFSVATAQRPEILIVDEALSVGDAYFQHKSFDRLRAFKAAGTTLVVVSHGMGDIRSLCDKVLILQDGKALRLGAPDVVIDFYNALIAQKDKARLAIEQSETDAGWVSTTSGTGEAVISHLAVYAAGEDAPIKRVRAGQGISIKVEIAIHTDVPRLVLGLMLRDRAGHVVWGSNTFHTGQVLEDLRAGETVEFRVDLPANFGPGSYSISPALVSTDTHLADNYQWTDHYSIFEVDNFDHPLFIGSSFIPATFTAHRNQK